MFFLKPNPVGTVHRNLLSNQVDEVVRSWEQKNPNPPSWWSNTKGIWTTAVSYIITATDYFILAIDIDAISSPDKKATVLAGLMEVYDVIVPPLLPIWLKPFNKVIKIFLFDIVVALMIDFIVGKYHQAAWKPS